MYINKKVIVAYAMERSGHRQAFEWLAKYSPLPVIDYYYINNRHYARRSKKFRWLTDKPVGNSDRWLIIDLEDPVLPFDFALSEKKKTLCGIMPETEVINLVMVRDPFNMMASRLQVTWHFHKTPQDVADCWKKLVKEGLRITTELSDPVVFFVYNWHFESEDYRRELGKQLGLTGDYHLQHQEVPTAGGGSSFDGRSFHGKASQMKVLERWKTEETNHALRILAEDEELVRLSKQLFGDKFIQEIVDRVYNG